MYSSLNSQVENIKNISLSEVKKEVRNKIITRFEEIRKDENNFKNIEIKEKLFWEDISNDIKDKTLKKFTLSL